MGGCGGGGGGGQLEVFLYLQWLGGKDSDARSGWMGVGARGISLFTMAWRRYFFAVFLFINPFMLRICIRKYHLEAMVCNIAMAIGYWTK